MDKKLIVMKKSREQPREGDVFVLQPIEKIFYYGKVIQTNLESKDSFINGMTLIYIYKCCSDKKVMPYRLEDAELLIAPLIINNQPWQKGYFETLGTISVSEKERKVDFAFWDVLRKEFVDINGHVIKQKPKYWSIYGLGSYGIIEKEINKAIKLIN